MIIGKFSLELIERRIFKNDMASSAIKSYLFIGKHIGFGLLNAKVASVLAKSIFFSSRGSRWGLDGVQMGVQMGSRWGCNWGVQVLYSPQI